MRELTQEELYHREEKERAYKAWITTGLEFKRIFLIALISTFVFMSTNIISKFY
jgi:hypothetical protein